MRCRGVRTYRGALFGRFLASNRPVSKLLGSRPGTLENSPTECYCPYSHGLTGEDALVAATHTMRSALTEG